MSVRLQPRVPHPVERIPTDPDDDAPDEAVALCLSGGGYRAMLYHTGALWRLHEMGILGKLDRVSSVSGGSIASARLALAWDRLRFDEAPAQRVAAFREHVVAPIRRTADRLVDLWVALPGIVAPRTSGARLAALYRRHLFGDAKLSALPAKGPRFIFNATSLQTKSLVRFTRDYVADWRVGRMRPDAADLAQAVAASSSFPPFLSPLVLRPRESDWFPTDPGETPPCRAPEYMTRMVLADGGVYDNLGLETAWKRCMEVLVSDAGGRYETRPDPSALWPIQFYRVNQLADDQVRSLRKQQAIDSFVTGTRRGAYWSTWTDPRKMTAPGALPCTPAGAARLASRPTRLAPQPAATQEGLINWGYAACDAMVRQHFHSKLVDFALAPAPSWPYPAHPV